MNLTTLTALAERGQILAASAYQSPPFALRIANADSDRADITLYDYIDNYDGVSAKDFVAQLRGITAKHIDLHINSGGGLVFDAIAMYAALRNHPAEVTVSVDGVAASAASFVAMAGDRIGIEKPAKMMIHDAQGITMGGPVQHREMLDLLEELSNTIAGIYADRAGGSVARWRQAMSATTWYGAAEAVKAGLADVVLGEDKAAPEDRRSQLIRARARATLGGVK